MARVYEGRRTWLDAAIGPVERLVYRLSGVRSSEEMGWTTYAGLMLLFNGTNDAPALAQADVAVAMNTGTQAAKEAGNMIDLDSNLTKLLEVVETGKQMLMTRGALATFSIAKR